MNIGIKKITIILFGLLLIASCGKKAEDATTTAIEDTQVVVVPTQTAEEKARLAEEGERMRAASVERENTVGKAEQEQLRSESRQLGNNNQQRNNSVADFQNMFACAYPYAEGMAFQLAVTIANVAADSSYGYASMLTTGDSAKFCQQAFGPASEENIKNAKQIAVRGNITYWVVDRGNAAVGMMSRR